MKKLFIGIAIGYILCLITQTVSANTSYISSEAVWNRVFNSSLNAVNVVGQ